MNKEQFQAELTKFSRGTHADGMRFVAQMARDMRDKMISGEMPAGDGPEALQLLAAMVERIIVERDATYPLP